MNERANNTFFSSLSLVHDLFLAFSIYTRFNSYIKQIRRSTTTTKTKILEEKKNLLKTNNYAKNDVICLQTFRFFLLAQCDYVTVCMLEVLCMCVCVC